MDEVLERPSMHDVEVHVNLKEELTLAKNASFPGMDGKGNILYYKKGQGCWRIDGKGKEVKIGGKGTKGWKIGSTKEGEGDALTLEHFCEIEEGIFWCIAYQFKSIVRIDINKTVGQLSVVVPGTADVEKPVDGFFGASAKSKGQNATVGDPTGPFVKVSTAEGDLVYFMDGISLRVANLATETIETICTSCSRETENCSFTYLLEVEADLECDFEEGEGVVSRTMNYSQGLIHHPSLLRPETQQNRSSSTLPTSSSLSSSSSSRQEHLSIPQTLTWLCSANHKETYIIDLQTGATSELSEDPLYPLVTIAPFLTIAVRDSSCSSFSIVLVDWAPPEELKHATTLLPNDLWNLKTRSEAIRTLETYRTWEFLLRTPIRLRSFVLRENHLYTYFNLTCSIERFANVLSIPPKIRNSNAIVTTLPSASEFRAGLEKLVDPDCPLTSDLLLVHGTSNTSWKAHSDILKIHEGLQTKAEVEKLTRVFKNSTLPVSSLSFFLSILYFGPVVKSSHEEAFMPVCHCLQLLNQLGIDTSLTHHLLWQLESQIVPKLSNDFLLQQILTLWFIEQDPAPESVATYSKTSPLMSILASRCRKYITESEIDDAFEKFDFSKVLLSGSQIAKLSSSITSIIAPSSSISLVEPKLNASATSIPSQPLKWEENLPVSSLTPDDNHYIFAIEGMKTGGVVCNALLLYPQWKWFERLTKTNCVEVKTRHVFMPAVFTPACLLALLSVPHGTYLKSETVLTLSKSDLAVICRFSEQLHLPENPRFAEFAEECHQILRSSITDNNCLEMLNSFFKAGFPITSEIVVEMIEMVYNRRKSISFDELLQLPTELRLLLGAYGDDKGNTKNEKFASLAASIQKCFEPEAQ